MSVKECFFEAERRQFSSLHCNVLMQTNWAWTSLYLLHVLHCSIDSGECHRPLSVTDCHRLDWTILLRESDRRDDTKTLSQSDWLITALYLTKVKLLISKKKKKKKLYNICRLFSLFSFSYCRQQVQQCATIILQGPSSSSPQERLPIQVLLSSTQLLTKGDAVHYRSNNGTSTYLP